MLHFTSLCIGIYLYMFSLTIMYNWGFVFDSNEQSLWEHIMASTPIAKATVWCLVLWGEVPRSFEKSVV